MKTTRNKTTQTRLRHMIISQAYKQFNQISNQYFLGSLSSQVLAKENKVCGFQVEVIPCYRRSLVYISFLCSRDYLQFTNEKNRVFGKYCGRMTGKTVFVSGQYALIKFHSDSKIQNRGFLMSFSAVVPPCKKWQLHGVYAFIIVIITLKHF